jgi:hypothetical protein
MIFFPAEKRRKIRKITPVKGINLCYRTGKGFKSQNWELGTGKF